MENVLNQAEQLAEAILESEEFIKMRLAEQATMRDEEAAGLIAAYSEKRAVVEGMLADSNLDHDKLTEAGTELDAAQQAMNDNALISTMRDANNAFSHMMEQVNKIIKFVITGEQEEEDGCSGSCESCGGCHH